MPNSTKKKVATAMNERIIKGTSSIRTYHPVKLIHHLIIIFNGARRIRVTVITPIKGPLFKRQLLEISKMVHINP